MHTEDTVLSDLLNGLGVIYAGEQVCPPSHSYGPAVRHYFLMHYVVSGKGIFEIGGKTYTLTSGDLFFIRPDEVTYYEADRVHPWHYVWIGLSGMDAASIFDAVSASRPVLHTENTDALTPLMQRFARIGSCRSASDRLERIGKLYEILSLLAKSAPPGAYRPSGRIYTEEAAMYIHANLDRRITVSELAKQISIDRSYLCALFKKYLDVSPQQYIIDAKMKSAASMLRRTDKPIAQIAEAVGYDDALLFSRMFRARFGMSPRQYRGLGM